MSRDIVAFIEYKNVESSEEKMFVCDEQVSLERYCNFYYLMLQTDPVYLTEPAIKHSSFKLCNYEPVINPRGLPIDISIQGQDKYGFLCKNFHAIERQNWLSLRELKEVEKEIKSLCNHTDPYLEPIIGKMRVLEKDGTKYSRLVFWYGVYYMSFLS